MKIRLILDWIIYLVVVALLTIIWTVGITYVVSNVSNIFEYSLKTPIKSDINMGLVLSIITTPIVLFWLSIGRLIDKRIRKSPIFLKEKKYSC